MKLRDLMTTTVITIGPEASLKEAARRMVEAGISGLPVTSETGDLVGIVTEADFVKAESGRRPDRRSRLLRWFTRDAEMPGLERTVGDVMTRPVIGLPPDSDHAEAARVMRRSGVKRIPVLDGSGKLVGIVSRSDILRAFVRPDGEIVDEINGELLRKILWIDPKRVDIICEDGNVSLSGRLETRSDAQLLIELTRRLDGVVSVADGLRWEVDNTKVEMTTPPPVARLW